MTELKDRIISGVRDQERRMAAFAEDLRRHPEGSWREFRTTAQIVEALRDMGLAPDVLPQETGVICDIRPSLRAARNRPMVALRADIDALPIPDPVLGTEHSHACGHHVHTAALIGAAGVLVRFGAVGLLPHPVRLVFQPAEEISPGGARAMIEAGACEDVSRIHALHCDPKLTLGTLATKEGAITSSNDYIDVVGHGAGGHTARPKETQDMVPLLGRMANLLPEAYAKRYDPQRKNPLVWGKIEAGTQRNAIPAQGGLSGTLRCPDIERWRNAPEELARAFEDVRELGGVRWELTHVRALPPVVNTDTDKAVSVIRSLFGDAAVGVTEQSTGAEDFAEYLQLDGMRGNLTRLGTRPHGVRVADTRGLHMAGYDPGTAPLFYAAAYLTGMAVDIAA